MVWALFGEYFQIQHIEVRHYNIILVMIMNVRESMTKPPIQSSFVWPKAQQGIDLNQPSPQLCVLESFLGCVNGSFMFQQEDGQ